MVFRKVFFFSLVVTAALSMSAAVFGYTPPQTVQVGLTACKTSSSLSLGTGEIEVGTWVKDSFESEATLSGNGSFTVSVPTLTMVDANEYYGSYKKAQRACEDLEDLWGYDFAPVYQEQELWGVAAVNLSAEDASRAKNDLNSSKTVSSAVLLSDSRQVIAVLTQNASLCAAGEKATSLGSCSFRGTISFLLSGSTITPVNTVLLDEYLYGVVPSEMPSSWETEALKAQAVAARSYALTRLTAHTSDGYQLCDSTHCQVYIGYGQEKTSTNNAVDETSGEVALYNGSPINAVFCSSSGGATDSGINVWVNEVPYLQAVPELVDEGVESWSRTYTASQISSFCASAGKPVGEVQDLQITATNPYGRVQELTVVGTSGTAVFQKEETRTLFQYSSEGSFPSRMYTINGQTSLYTPSTQAPTQTTTQTTTQQTPSATSTYAVSANGTEALQGKDHYFLGSDGNMVQSNLDEPFVYQNGQSNSFSISLAPSNVFLAAEKTYTFTGKGNGHGVGMSQYGANAMAKAGYDYIDILTHYYTGITVE